MQGLLDLEGTALTPILVSLVKKDAGLLDAFGKGASDDIQVCFWGLSQSKTCGPLAVGTACLVYWWQLKESSMGDHCVQLHLPEHWVPLARMLLPTCAWHLNHSLTQLVSDKHAQQRLRCRLPRRSCTAR